MGTPQNQCHLGELGRLEGHDAEVEPTACTLAFGTDTGNEHQHQHGDRDQEQWKRQLSEVPNRQPESDVERDDSQRDTDQLLGEEGVPGLVCCEGFGGRRRQDHDQAQHREQHCDRDDEVEGRERPAEPQADSGTWSGGASRRTRRLACGGHDRGDPMSVASRSWTDSAKLRPRWP